MWRNQLIGTSDAIERLAQTIALLAPRRCTVLITGETGTGKEMVARAIHQASDRVRFPMVSLNCSAIPEHLLEAELFGHTRGAFTGAVASRVGRFEQADRGTLFLDEIGDLQLDLQVKLLRVIQEREVQRLGSQETCKVNVRVIAASNVNLEERVQQGRFRSDLYYRLNVVQIEIPPLRERMGDLPLLAHHFVGKICRAEGIPSKQVSPETLAYLARYSWPGNVRELENMVERAVVLSGERETLLPRDFALPEDPGRRFTNAEPCNDFPEGGLDLAREVIRFEKDLLDQALERTHGNKTMAADLLRLKRTTLLSKLRSYQNTFRAAC